MSGTFDKGMLSLLRIGGLQLGFGSAFPVVAPSAPGNVAKKSLNVRFSWIIGTTCFMGLGELELRLEDSD